MTEERTLSIDHLCLETVEELPGVVVTRIYRHTLQGRQETLEIHKGNEAEAMAFLGPLARALGVEIQKG